MDKLLSRLNETLRSLFHSQEEALSLLALDLPVGLAGMVVDEVKGYPLCYANLAVAQIMDLAPEEYEQAANAGLESMIHPDDRYASYATLRDALHENKPYRMTMRIKTFKGAIKQILINGLPLKQKLDGCTVVMAVVSDITSVSAEVDASHDKNSQIASYAQYAPGGVVRFRVDGNYTLLYANDILCNMVGYTIEQLREQHGSACMALIEPEDLEVTHKAIMEVIQRKGERFATRIRLRHADGRVLPLLVSGVLLYEPDQAPMFYAFVLDQSAIRDTLQALRRSEDRFRIALEHANISVWEYDIATKRIELSEQAMREHKYDKMVEDVPESVLANGFIHPDSAQDFLSLYTNLNAGVPVTEVTIRHRTHDGTWRWSKISFNAVFGDDGKPVRAVAVTQDVTAQKENEERFEREEQINRVISENLIGSSRINLTQNKVEWVTLDGNPWAKLAPGTSYDRLCAMGEESTPIPEDRKRYNDLFSRNALLMAFRMGKTGVSLEYRFKQSNGHIIWVNGVMHMMHAPNGEDVICLGYVQNIDEKKKLELALRQRAERDTVTGMYRRSTMASMVDEALAEGSFAPGSRCALMVLSIDAFDQRREQYGVRRMDELLSELAQLLTLNFEGNHIVGRISGGIFAVFLPDITSTGTVVRKAENLAQMLSVPYLLSGSSAGINARIGVTMPFAGGQSFAGMYEQALAALDAGKLSGNAVTVYGPGLAVAKAADAPAKESAAPQPKANSAAHTQREEVMLSCVSSLLMADSLETSMQLALGSVGGYYKAEQALIAELDPDTGISSPSFCWRPTELPPDPSLAESIRLPMLPRWQEMFVRGEVIAITDMAAFGAQYPQEYAMLRLVGVQSLLAAPLLQQERCIGFLLLENVTAHAGDLALLNSLPYLIVSEIYKRRLQKKQEYLSYFDALTGLRNRNSYLELSSRIRVDAVTSIGVVAADINGLSKVNQTFGHESGDDLIRGVARILRSHFREYEVFRLEGDKFRVLAQDITYEAFSAKLSLLREEIASSCEQGLSIGYTWANNDFDLEKLTEHAEELMRIEKQEYYLSGEENRKHYRPNMVHSLQQSLKAGEFQVYLQPKANINNGEVNGAEALVRHIHPTYGVIYPTRFIGTLEKEGLVHFVDFYVMEQVFKILADWQRRGLELMPISVNFSRSTMLEPHLIQRLEELADRYCQVPRSLVEIEITESLGEMEHATIAAIGRRIMEAGFALCLDDFGSKYTSLSVLSAMDFRVLKLDKSLINDLVTNPRSRAVVRNALGICEDLNVVSLAEGVETQEQLDVLRELGCSYAQGYLFNKPIPLPLFEKKYIHPVVK